MADEKILLNVEETAAYLGIGKTKCREFLREYEHDFVIRIGNRIYANKNLLEPVSYTHLTLPTTPYV